MTIITPLISDYTQQGWHTFKKKQCSFGYLGALYRKLLSHSVQSAKDAVQEESAELLAGSCPDGTQNPYTNIGYDMLLQESLLHWHQWQRPLNTVPLDKLTVAQPDKKFPVCYVSGKRINLITTKLQDNKKQLQKYEMRFSERCCSAFNHGRCRLINS